MRQEFSYCGDSYSLSLNLFLLRFIYQFKKSNRIFRSLYTRTYHTSLYFPSWNKNIPPLLVLVTFIVQKILMPIPGWTIFSSGRRVLRKKIASKKKFCYFSPCIYPCILCFSLWSPSMRWPGMGWVGDSLVGGACVPWWQKHKQSGG